MPRAEAGSTKAIANGMKAKGLTRLRWYCQICEKACRDENGFKCHTQSESHVRNMRLASENGSRVINDFSKQFQQDFILLLQRSHGTKPQNANHFYNEFIADRHHVHMNATKWKSLTEFVKHLGKEGICRVEETEKGLFISWIDNSPEALRRQAAIQKRERMEKGDEEREQRMLEQQIQRAQAQTREDEEDTEAHILTRADGAEKITLDFGSKLTASKPPSPPINNSTETKGSDDGDTIIQTVTPPPENKQAQSSGPVKISLGGGGISKPKNVFASAKKNPFASQKKAQIEPAKKMSEMERIMKEELERKRPRDGQSSRSTNEKRLKLG